MADPKRQSIIDALEARLQTILTSNGYETNVGSNVYERHPKPVPIANIPCVIYADVEEEISLVTQETNRFISVELEIFTAGTTALNTIRKILADIEKAIGTDKGTFGGLAVTTWILENTLAMDQESKIISGAVMTIRIHFKTNQYDPYS